MVSMASQAKRPATAQRLQRQIDALTRLCGTQLEKIGKRQRENEKLRRQLAAGEGWGGGAGEYKYPLAPHTRPPPQ